jgi:hypothetical protein
VICLPYVVACVLAGMPAPGASHPALANRAPSQTARDWTDASGTRQVRAVLLRVEGDQLWLKRANGQLATTTLDRLSQADRDYLARSLSPQPTNQQAASNAISPSFIDYIPSIAGVIATLQAPPANTERCIVPAAFVHVRISRRFLEDYVEHNVNRRKPVTDCILGTSIRGESTTIGQTHIVLLPSSNSLLGEITFDGTVRARTVGHNGPAVLHYLSDTSFQSRKPIRWDASGLSVSPASTSAPTVLKTTGVGSTSPGLRGRIVTRIASRRDARSHCEAEAITARHTAATISEDFDERIDDSVARVQKVFQEKIPQELGFDFDQEMITRYRTTSDYVEMAMIRRGASPEECSLRPPAVTEDPDIAVRLNRSMLRGKLADTELSVSLAPLLLRVLDARAVKQAIAAIGTDSSQLVDSTKWSIEPNWVTLDYTDAERDSE